MPRYTSPFCASPTNQNNLSPFINMRKKYGYIKLMVILPLKSIEKISADAKDTYFTNKGYKELQVNFVGVKSMCDCCLTSFQSCSTLHRHIKSGYNTLGKIAVAETGLDSSSSRPVLCSTAKLYSPGSGLTFRGWSYATTPITFDLAILLAISDSNTLVYLDTGCGVSLVDKT